MAAKGKEAQEKLQEKLTRKVSFAYVHKLAAAVSLLAFFVIIAAGIKAQSSVHTMVLRSCVVIIAVGLVARIVVRVLGSYEEINSGKS